MSCRAAHLAKTTIQCALFYNGFAMLLRMSRVALVLIGLWYTWVFTDSLAQALQKFAMVSAQKPLKWPGHRWLLS
eukprot:5897441-Karenia_brevis.AAC.1